MGTAAPVVTRPAVREDMEGVLAIYNDAVLHTTATADYAPQTLEQRLEWFDVRQRGAYPVLVAEEAGRVVGWASLSPYHARAGYRFSAEVSIYVAADRRGRGIGQALLGPLVEAGRARGLHAIIAGVDGPNEASLRLHRRFGFEERGRLKEVFCKFDRWLDVVYLELLLT